MKHIVIAIVTVIIIAMHTQANAQGIGGLMTTVEQSMPILERLAAADETDLAVHCAGNQECIEGMRRDVKVLGQALDILKNQSAGYNANRVALDAQDSLIRGNK